MRNIRSLCRPGTQRKLRLWIFAGIVLAQLGGACAQTALFSPAPVTKSADLAPQRNDAVTRQRFTAINSAAVADAATTATGENLLLEFFEDARFLVTLDNKKSGAGKSEFTRTGRVAGKPLATFHMAVVGEATVIDLRLPDGITYSVRYRGKDVHEITEVMEAAQAPCGTTGSLTVKQPPPGSQSSSRGVPSSADTAGEIDVLVAYTAEAEAAAGGASGIQAQINLAFSHANVSYTNSQIPLTLVKVGTLKVNYTPNANMGVDLSRLQSKTDGIMDEVHSVRNSLGADMVSLLVGTATGGACGIGYLMSAVNSTFDPFCFTVCALPCISNQTFAHELGHNMGCDHDITNASGTTLAYPYAYGWRWTGASLLNWRSVMAYAPGTRVQHFSNPDVNYDSVPTGVANISDNSQVIENTALTVANFRQRTPVPGPTLAALPDPLNISVAQGSDGAAVIKVGNSGTGTINYTISETASWATISPTSGTASSVGAAFTDHVLTLDTDSLALGNYTATVNITGSGGVSSKSIPIALTVFNETSNDNFVDAYIITGASGSISGTTVNSTRETGEPTTIAGETGSRSIWYKWTAPSSLAVQFDTVGSNFDTLLGAYTGNLGSLVVRAENDDVVGLNSRSQIAFVPVGGTTYSILVDGYSGANGSVILNWSSASAVSDWSVY